MKIVNKLSNKAKAGFSLVELLVVIAVIGILAAIAIPALSNVFESSTKAKAQRNAQAIASMYTSARAAGADFPVGSTTVAAIAGDLATGVSGKPPFAETYFTLSPMSADEKANAAQFLTLDTTKKTMAYDVSASFTPVGSTN